MYLCIYAVFKSLDGLRTSVPTNMWNVRNETSRTTCQSCLIEQSRTEQNRTEHIRTEQNRTEQSREEQNRTEQNRTEQSRTEKNIIAIEDVYIYN